MLESSLRQIQDEKQMLKFKPILSVMLEQTGISCYSFFFLVSVFLKYCAATTDFQNSSLSIVVPCRKEQHRSRHNGTGKCVTQPSFPSTIIHTSFTVTNPQNSFMYLLGAFFCGFSCSVSSVVQEDYVAALFLFLIY